MTRQLKKCGDCPQFKATLVGEGSAGQASKNLMPLFKPPTSPLASPIDARGTFWATCL